MIHSELHQAKINIIRAIADIKRDAHDAIPYIEEREDPAIEQELLKDKKKYELQIMLCDELISYLRDRCAQLEVNA